MLLAAQADPNAVNHAGQTPLQAALGERWHRWDSAGVMVRILFSLTNSSKWLEPTDLRSCVRLLLAARATVHPHDLDRLSVMGIEVEGTQVEAGNVCVVGRRRQYRSWWEAPSQVVLIPVASRVSHGGDVSNPFDDNPQQETSEVSMLKQKTA